MSFRRPSVLNRSSTQATELPTQEDQIRGYRAMTRGRLHALHRRSAGTNALVVLIDTRWEDSRQIIGTMEVDLSAGTQLVYMFPDMVLSIDDFHNHVEVAIQTHGYDTWQGGEINLLVTMAMIGRLSNTSHMGFQYSVDNVVDHLTTTSITAIPGERKSIEELEGKSWNLKPSEQTTVCVPSRVAVNERLNRSLSLQFKRYRQVPQPARYDAPKNTTPIEEIAATGWGDEFSDDETTPGRDDQLATRKQRSELEWENPFAAKRGYGEYYNSQWTLPPAWTESGVMLVLPADPCLWSDVISRWESITINRLNSQTWSDNKAKIAFVENLLGESEKLMWQQWRTAYPRAYSALETIADDPQNITSQVRQLIIMEDPYRGSTDEQDRAYRDLDKITCEETKNLWSFLEDFQQLAIKSGKLYFPSTTEKLFAKLPPSLSKKIEESFKARHPDAALAKELRDLSLCSATPIPGYYKNNRKKYRIRKSRTYKGKPHNSHVKPFKRKYKDDRGRVKKCKCFICGKERHFAKDCRINVKRKQQHKLEKEKDFSSNKVRLLKEILKEKTEQVQQIIRDRAKEYYEGKIAMQDKEELWQTERSLLVRDLTDALKIIDQLKAKQMRLEKEKDEEIKKLKAQLQEKKDKEIEVQFSREGFPPLGNSQIARPFMEAEAHYYGNTTTAQKIRKIANQLYNVKVEFEIPSCPIFGTTAIIDTGASTCCINKKVIPEEALEPLTQIVFFNGLNSRQQATHRIKQGSFLIEGNKLKIPLIYAFDVRDSNDIEMLIGANFLSSMKGGIRIEGDEITIYKKVTRIKTSNQTEIAEIDELEVSEEEFLEINESIYFNREGIKAFLEQFKPVIYRLKHQGYIGEEPLKHWKKNGELCKLEIINPYITIEDRPLKHVTPAMEDSFKKHVNSLLEIGAIRPRKERMVFNCKSLNENTYKDQYSLPGINTIIKRVADAKVFSKFDLKSGFHQVAMDEESIPWTAFLVPGGLYEWLVMPFGLKNAPTVFQRKMDKCFKGTESFIAEHAKHLERMLKICEDNGLVLSPTKTKIAVSTIDFLGAVIEEGTIKLQPHIIKKIVNFNEEELKTKKGLRSFLGILNYARNHIPKLGILLRPLYEKTNAHGDKRLKSYDYELVRKIKEYVQNLPDLEIPPENAYIILETDGCMEGWGGIVKWKKSTADPRSSERICAYASGKFSTTQSTIDAKINACLNTLEMLKIYYLGKVSAILCLIIKVKFVGQSM
nr:TPA: orf y [Tanacetum cinerariifolium]